MQKSDGITHLSEKEGVTQVIYHGVFVPNIDVPLALGIPAIESATRKQFEGLVHEIQRRSSSQQ